MSERDRAKDQAEGIALGEEGADAALNSYAVTSVTASDWRIKAEARLDALIESGFEFTSEDVIDKVGVAPSPNAIGGLFQSRRERMFVTGFVIATRKEAHGRALRVWRGKLPGDG